MVGKYDHLFVRPGALLGLDALAERRSEIQTFSFNNHDEAPFYFESYMQYPREFICAYGEEITYPTDSWLGQQTAATGLKYFAYPHTHPFQETFLLMSVDPEDPQDLGATMEMWIGEGQDAELYEMSEPSMVVIPPGLRHLPMRLKNTRRAFLLLVIADAKSFARTSPWKDPVYPPSVDYVKKRGWQPEPQSEQQSAKRDYACLVKTMNSKEFLRAPPAHRKKSRTIMHATWQDNDQFRKRVDCTLVLGDGIGFGVGDWNQFPPVPHKSPCWATLSFFSLDPQQDDLGGTVEVWLGEGEDAERHIVDTTTTIIIPPGVVSYPIYVRSFERPFVICSIIDSPLFAGRLLETFPPEFEHLNIVKKGKSAAKA